jgi:hypothetical protein
MRLHGVISSRAMWAKGVMTGTGRCDQQVSKSQVSKSQETSSPFFETLRL